MNYDTDSFQKDPYRKWPLNFSTGGFLGGAGRSMQKFRSSAGKI
jgi:hypothetical protein